MQTSAKMYTFAFHSNCNIMLMYKHTKLHWLIYTHVHVYIYSTRILTAHGINNNEQLVRECFPNKAHRALSLSLSFSVLAR